MYLSMYISFTDIKVLFTYNKVESIDLQWDIFALESIIINILYFLKFLSVSLTLAAISSDK